MRKSAKMILFLILSLCVLAVIALVFAANYMFTYALDSQFGGGVDIRSFEVLPGTVEEWLVQNSSIESLQSHDGLNLKAYFIPAATKTNKYVLLQGWPLEHGSLRPALSSAGMECAAAPSSCPRRKRRSLHRYGLAGAS